MKRTITVDGNEACSYTSYYFSEIAGVYPITPATPMSELFETWSREGRKNLFGQPVSVVEMQSEAGAAGFVHGSLQAGSLATTFTASQGLLLMIPNLYKIAGEMLPGVVHVAARSIATHALSVMGDHQDIYATRMTGLAILASSSVQDASYLSAIAHLSALKASLPVLHFFDGFRTSHEVQKIEVLEEEDYASLLDPHVVESFRKKAMQPGKAIVHGTNQQDDIYFQATEVRNMFYDQLPDIVNLYMTKLNAVADTHYAPFVYYGKEDAKYIIVAMGSICDTIKETVDGLDEVGMIEVHLYRPFSRKYFYRVLPSTVQKIAVLDRTKEPGGRDPLYLDIVEVLTNTGIEIIGGRYGLSGKNTTPQDIKAVFDLLTKEDSSKKNPFTLGIVDDITHLHLQPDSSFMVRSCPEYLIYGYGSDGMISVSKSFIEMVGQCTDYYVQGYFEYDSKKSGGITKCHLRVDDQVIRKPYYVEHPSIVIITKDSYLNSFDCYSNIEEEGILIINTSKAKEELKAFLPDDLKEYCIRNRIEVYQINAYALARKAGLGNRISTIMETILAYIANLVPFDEAKEKIKMSARERYFKKGEKIYRANKQVIEEALFSLVEVDLKDEFYILEEKDRIRNVFEAMKKRRGYELATSAFLRHPDGTFPGGTSILEKRAISEVVPKWISSNCIECNQCSFVCPHSVIRPFLLSEKEYQKAPEQIKNRCKVRKIKNKTYYFTIAISVDDCTGCGVCIHTCPGLKKQKALTFYQYNEARKSKMQDVFEYLNEHVSEKNVFSSDTVQGSQMIKPKFQFCGACPGCGETSYIKILTQLFRDEIMIANATGCSSIYGASAPSMPYTIPWSNSLFEDNAEFGYGIAVANRKMRENLASYMQNHLEEHPLYEKWLKNKEDYKMTKEIYDQLEKEGFPNGLLPLKEWIVSRMVWCIGGDGWAYDIGFSGIDHVLASGENINILVLNSEVYSNTGGQASKATPLGSVAAFTEGGKRTSKKDLAQIALTYRNVYVAQISLGANMKQVLTVFKEAATYPGPSLILAYSPCIAHGISGGMKYSVQMQKEASLCGYFPIFHYQPKTKIFTLDQKRVDFNRYKKFLLKQNRYSLLYKVNKEQADQLLEEQQKNAEERYEIYLKMQG